MHRVFLAALLLTGGCGRRGFDRELDGGADDATPDAASRPNIVFATSMKLPGSFGAVGNPLAVADAVCASAATAGGLPGTFVAWLSTPTTNAIDRLTGSRGWVRVDGVPVADTVQDIAAFNVFNPISRDEHGAEATSYTWTGTGGTGVQGDFGNCEGWTSASNVVLASIGCTHSVGFSQCNGGACGEMAALFCFEIGNVAPVSLPSFPRGRIAFVSTPIAVTVGSGIAAFDARCSTEATAAALPGTYRAAVATSVASIASRFTLDTRAWTRVDGAVVALNGAALFDGSNWLAPVNQRADGVRVGYIVAFGNFTWVGAPDALSTATNACTDWSDPATVMSAEMGDPGFTAVNMWDTGQSNCTNSGLPVLCLQE